MEVKFIGSMELFDPGFNNERAKGPIGSESFRFHAAV